jgi:hypothetical protein
VQGHRGTTSRREGRSRSSEQKSRHSRAPATTFTAPDSGQPWAPGPEERACNLPVKCAMRMPGDHPSFGPQTRPMKTPPQRPQDHRSLRASLLFPARSCSCRPRNWGIHDEGAWARRRPGRARDPSSSGRRGSFCYLSCTLSVFSSDLASTHTFICFVGFIMLSCCLSSVTACPLYYCKALCCRHPLFTRP